MLTEADRKQSKLQEQVLGDLNVRLDVVVGEPLVEDSSNQGSESKGPDIALIQLEACNALSGRSW